MAEGDGAARLEAISPFFIVADVTRSLIFYRDRLGFDIRFAEPAERPFFAIVGRDAAQLLLKADSEVAPLPNRVRHASMRWDAFVYTSEPDGLALDLTERGAAFTMPLADTHDGLRGFEVEDPDGYTLFFGRPR
ncbi:MAG TPA: VOC family protein [Sphingomonas sp.]|nr:VOC family protein [Sphingomonas sp.]